MHNQASAVDLPADDPVAWVASAVDCAASSPQHVLSVEIQWYWGFRKHRRRQQGEEVSSGDVELGSGTDMVGVAVDLDS